MWTTEEATDRAERAECFGCDSRWPTLPFQTEVQPLQSYILREALCNTVGLTSEEMCPGFFVCVGEIYRLPFNPRGLLRDIGILEAQTG